MKIYDLFSFLHIKRICRIKERISLLMYRYVNKEQAVQVLLDSFFFQKMFKTIDLHPGQKLRAGSGRKASEITGTWKQYSNRKIFGFFPMISDRFLPESTGN